jgi:hypothetical protein
VDLERFFFLSLAIRLNFIKLKQEHETRMEESSTENDDDALPESIGSGIDWKRLSETCVRVTAAGFFGSLVGLSREYRDQAKEVTTPRPRRGPPRAAIRPLSHTLPLSWAISCMAIASVLESSRWSSPVGRILEYYDSMHDHHSPDEELRENEQQIENLFLDKQMVKLAITSTGDCAIGGLVAGLAGAVAQERQIVQLYNTGGVTVVRPKMKLFGMILGMTLGMIAGCAQAAYDVVELYSNRQSEVQPNEDEQDSLESNEKKKDQQSSI